MLCIIRERQLYYFSIIASVIQKLWALYWFFAVCSSIKSYRQGPVWLCQYFHYTHAAKCISLSSLHYLKSMISLCLFVINNEVLCISEASANEFSAILILFLVQSNSNSPRSLECFRRTLRQKFNLLRQQMKNFPIDPHCKNCWLSAISSDVF